MLLCPVTDDFVSGLTQRINYNVRRSGELEQQLSEPNLMRLRQARWVLREYNCTGTLRSESLIRILETHPELPEN